jgi:hypothetical protein
LPQMDQSRGQMTEVRGQKWSISNFLTSDFRPLNSVLDDTLFGREFQASRTPRSNRVRRRFGAPESCRAREEPL